MIVASSATQVNKGYDRRMDNRPDPDRLIVDAVIFAETRQLLATFDYRHLPEPLQNVSRPFGELAETIAAGPAVFETVAALRHLLQAKDAAVRAVVSRPRPSA